MVEIPRSVGPALAKLVLGAMIAGVSGLLVVVAPAPAVKAVAALVFGLGLVMLVGGWQVVARRPPWLRATPAGLWFGGGPIIPWPEVTAIYHDAVARRHPLGFTTQPRTVAFELRRKLTFLRLPVSCWLTTIIPGDVQVPVERHRETATVLLARLEAMRTAACGNEDGVVAGSTSPPPARVHRR